MRRILSTLLSILFSAALYANTSTKVECVTELVTLTTPIDYIITSDSETDAITGTLAIANDCVAVIFENLKPTVTSKTAFLANVTINGRKAVDGTNCHVAVYRHGSILFPYCKTPLTVYNEAGESKSVWTVGSAYRVLSKWDNCITRFTLKRGYMVTMANHSDGTGYSHVFVAQDEDLDVTLPAAMQQSVSFLRVFEWNYPGKKGLAEDNTKAAGLMNMGWFYNWAASNYQYQNFDYVPERHHESGWTKNGEYKGAWPSWDEINSNVATHVLGMNEPDNGSVEVYMTPEDMFKHHKDYLKSGMRIGTFACCNPNKDWVTRYVNLCKQNNMRVDFVATHYYLGGTSPDSFIGSLQELHDATGLPVWVTEWNNGASWTSESGFTTDSQGWVGWSNTDHAWNHKINGVWFVDCLKKADRHTWIERLAIYNDVDYKRYVHYSDGYPTPAGERVRDYNSNVAYSKYNEVWMPWNASAPKNLKGTLDDDGQVTLTWTNPNTDCTKKVLVEERHTTETGNTWETVLTLGVDDKENRTLTFDSTLLTGDKMVRISNEDHDGKVRRTNSVQLGGSDDAPKEFEAIYAIPDDYDNYYYMFFSQRCEQPACLGLQDAGGVQAMYLQTPSAEGYSLSQVWQLEKSSNYSGFAFRNLGVPDYVVCRTPNYWNVSATDTHLGRTECGANIVFNDADLYFTIQSAQNTGNYFGLWTTDNGFKAGERISWSLQWADADHYSVYAIRKADFNSIYLEANKPCTAHYALNNMDFTWGTSSAVVEGSGGCIDYPIRWTFQKTFSGWNDTKLVDATFSDGTQGTAANIWAGTIAYAELSQHTTALPNGVYRISADVATEVSPRTETTIAIYGNPGNNDWMGRSYNVAGTGENDYQHCECYVVVTDEELTFGVRTDAKWLKAGNFKVEYLGKLDDADATLWSEVDNCRALQRLYTRGNRLWLDLTAYEHCNQLQIEPTTLPNALVWMAPTASIDVAYNQENIIVGNRCQHFVVTDEKPLDTQSDFTAETLTYQRNDGAGEWHEFYVPFAVEANDNVEVARIAGANTEGVVQYYEAEQTLANTPAFVRFNVPTFELTNTHVSPCTSYAANNIKGVYEAGRTVPPLRWYVPGISQYTMELIDGIGALRSSSQATAYDLKGVRMTAPLKKGVYIVNGKKTIK